MTGSSMTRDPARHPADGPVARLLAALVLLSVIAALAAIHWEAFFPPEETEAAGSGSVARRIARQTAEIEAMIAEKPQMARRRAQMLQRVAPMCEDLAGEGSSAAPPPLDP